MTDKVQKIREEVVRMHNLLPIMGGDNISVNYADRICTTLEMYIDSLQEEQLTRSVTKTSDQEEPVSEGLEEAAENYGIRQGIELKPFAIKYFKAGAKWQKEQMMAKAIDGKVIVNGMGNPILHLWDKGRHLIDKKVKVIVIKEN